MVTRLSTKEIDVTLRSLGDWTLTEGKLHREFKFPDFSRAFGFMTSGRPPRSFLLAIHSPDFKFIDDRVRARSRE